MVRVRLRSKVIRMILARKHKSQNWLAGKLAISSGYMAQLLSGARCPSPELRERIQEYLQDHSFDDLFLIKG